MAQACEEIAAFAPEVVILDVALPDGSAFDVLACLQQASAFPVVLAMSGTATPVDTFRLAAAGVRAFMQKPLTLDAVCQALVAALEAPPDVTPFIRSQVGHVPVHDMEQRVRHTMVDEALARAGGSRRGAARLLSISRQLLQHILRKEPPGSADAKMGDVDEPR